MYNRGCSDGCPRPAQCDKPEQTRVGLWLGIDDSGGELTSPHVGGYINLLQDLVRSRDWNVLAISTLGNFENLEPYRSVRCCRILREWP